MVAEVLCHMRTKEAETVLRQIKAMGSWANLTGGLVLPWMDEAIAEYAFGKVIDLGFARCVQDVLVTCFSAPDAKSLQQGLEPLCDLLDSAKAGQAQAFQDMYLAAKALAPDTKLRGVLNAALSRGFLGRVLALGIPVEQDTSHLEAVFGAYYEYEKEKFHVATSLPYNANKHRNDALDVEYLLYLAAPELIFLTCDRGFGKINRSPQKKRICIAAASTLGNAQECESLIEHLLQMH